MSINVVWNKLLKSLKKTVLSSHRLCFPGEIAPSPLGGRDSVAPLIATSTSEEISLSRSESYFLRYDPESFVPVVKQRGTILTGRVLLFTVNISRNLVYRFP